MNMQDRVAPGGAATSPEEIEQRLAAQRRDLAASVDALAERVSPRAQARAAGEQLGAQAGRALTSARDRVEDLRDCVRTTLEGARQGRAPSLKRVAGAAGGAIAAAAVLGALISRRR